MPSDERDYAMERDVVAGGWRLLGDAAEYAVTKQRRAIIEALADSDKPLRPKEIADVTGEPHENVKKLCPKMARDVQIKATGDGRYTTLGEGSL